MSQGASIAVLARKPIVPLSEVASANRQRDALYQLSEQLHRAVTPKDTYDAAMDAIESALDCERSAILLFDDAGVMQFVASRGLGPSYRAAVTGHSPWKAGDMGATPIAIADVESADLEDGLKSTVLGEGIRAVAFIPLVSDGALIGKFMAYFHEPRQFSKDDLSVSLVIARQLAFAVQRNRTDQQLRAREQELADELAATRQIQELSLEMAHAVDIEALYQRLTSAAVAIMRADFGSLQQYYPHLGSRGELKLLAYRGFEPDTARFWDWVRADSPSTCGKAISTRARVIDEDIGNADYMAGTPHQSNLLEAGVRSAQTTP